MAQAGMCEIEAGRQGIGNCTNAIAKNWLEIFTFQFKFYNLWLGAHSNAVDDAYTSREFVQTVETALVKCKLICLSEFRSYVH